MLNGELWTGKKYAAGAECSGFGRRSKKALAGAVALAMLVTMGFSACGISSTEGAASKPEVSDSSKTNKETEKNPRLKRRRHRFRYRIYPKSHGMSIRR